MRTTIWMMMQDVIASAVAVNAFGQSGKASGHVRVAINIVIWPGHHRRRLIVPNAVMMRTAQPQPQSKGEQQRDSGVEFWGKGNKNKSTH